MWSDPDWEQMLRESELIALVEVIEGGRYIAKVKVVRALKGNITGEFFVTDYNNNQWPREAIKAESFQKRQEYYLFLKPQKEERGDLTFLATLAEETGDTAMKKMLGRLDTHELRYVWTPSAGDLRVEKGQVHYSLLRTSYSLSAPGRDRAAFERFLEAAIAYQANVAVASDLLKQTLQEIRESSSRPIPPDGQESDLAHSVATYYLLGGRAYDDVFEKIASGKDANARFMLARLLGGITGEQAHKLLLTMLADANSLVQGEVVRQLARSNANEVGAILLERLNGAGEGGIGPEGIMDPVQNRVDGGKLEIIRAFGELKYQPAAPALIRLLEGCGNAYPLQVVLQSLEAMGNRDYAPALEKLLSEGKLIYEIAQWARDHHVSELKEAFVRLLDNTPPGTRGVDLSSVSETLGAIGDETAAAKLTAYLEKLTSRALPEAFERDQALAQELIGALAALRYRPARSAVERSFFYWFGVDSAFAAKPELLKTKEQLELEIEREAKRCLGEFGEVHTQVLVFLENRAALVSGLETQAKYNFVLHVDVPSRKHPELKAESLKAQLVKAFATRNGTIGVTRWEGHMGMQSEGNDARVGGRFDSQYLWRYGEYVQAVHEPADVQFVKFLLESGLAKRWGAADETVEAFKSISDQSPK